MFFLKKHINNLYMPIIGILILLLSYLAVDDYLELINNESEKQSNIILKQSKLCGIAIESSFIEFETELKFLVSTFDLDQYLDKDKDLTDNKYLNRFYSKHQDIINRFRITNNTSYRDIVRGEKNYFEQYEILNHPKTIELTKNKTIDTENGFVYVLPIFDGYAKVKYNIRVELNIPRFMESHFENFYIGKNSWQWIIDNESKFRSVFYSESKLSKDSFVVEQIDKIKNNLWLEYEGNLDHKIISKDVSYEVLSAYYPVRLANQKYGIIFSIDRDTLFSSIEANTFSILTFYILILILLIVLFSGILLQRKAADNKVKQMSESLQKIIDFMPVGMIFSTRNKKILDVNNTALELLGLDDKDDLIGAQCFNVIPGKGHPNCQSSQICPIIDENKNIRNKKATLHKRNGDEITILKTAIEIEHLEVPTILETFIDISDLESARSKLKESEQRLELALLGADLGLWDWDLANKSFTANQRFMDIMEQDGIVFEPSFTQWMHAIHPNDRKKFKAKMKIHFRSLSPQFEVEYRTQVKDNRWKWILAKGKVVARNSKGMPLRTVGTVLDITERKNAEERLRMSHERFTTVLNSIDAIIYVSDLQSYEVLFTNKYTQDLLGDIKGRICWQVLQSDKYEPCEFCTNDKIVDAEGKPGEVLVWELYNDKMERWYEVHDRAIYWVDGRVVRFEIATDITDRKKAETQLRLAKQAAEDANKAKSEFLANMSHEIRTPMNAILGFSEILLQEVQDHKHKGYLDTILNSGNTLLSLINDILDLSKIESGKLDLNLEPTDLKIIFQEIKQVFSQKIISKDLNYISEIDKNLPTKIVVDEIRVRQLLFNLVGNAIKFTDSGYVKVSAELLSIEKDKRINIELSIEDTGIGIPEDQIDIIFESFRQQSGQSTRKYGGTGLGLAITEKLVEMMNGRVEVKSTPGKGSIFKVILPNIEIADTDFVYVKEKRDSADIFFEGIKVLVVDDITDNRNLVKTYLNNSNIIIDEAEDGSQAVEMIEQNTYDIIFMDIRMPVLDGYAATETIRQTYPAIGTKIIALTASSMKTDQKRIDILFDDFLRKPVSKQELFDTISKYFKPTEKERLNKKESSFSGQQIDKLEIPEEILSQIPYVITTLEKLYADHFEDDSAFMELEKVESFTQSILDISSNFQINILNLYSEKLAQVVSDIEFDKIEELLYGFGGMIDKIKKHIGYL